MLKEVQSNDGLVSVKEFLLVGHKPGCEALRPVTFNPIRIKETLTLKGAHTPILWKDTEYKEACCLDNNCGQPLPGGVSPYSNHGIYSRIDSLFYQPYHQTTQALVINKPPYVIGDSGMRSKYTKLYKLIDVSDDQRECTYTTRLQRQHALNLDNLEALASRIGIDIVSTSQAKKLLHYTREQINEWELS